VVAYEFYVHDEKGRWDSIGILPERRKDPLRITQEAIMKWGKMLAFDNVDVVNHIYFIQIEI
jgi:hypothetical protein